jgi:hypothetical protein
MSLPSSGYSGPLNRDRQYWKMQVHPCEPLISGGVVSDQIGQDYDTLIFGDIASSFVELVDQTASSD